VRVSDEIQGYAEVCEICEEPEPCRCDQKCRACRFGVEQMNRFATWDDYVCRMPKGEHKAAKLPPDFPYADKHEGCGDFEDRSDHWKFVPSRVEPVVPLLPHGGEEDD